MRQILLGVVVGIASWLTFIFVIVFLQLNGLLLNKVILVDLGQYSGWDPLIALGTLGSAFAALFAAVIALKVDAKNREERRIRENALAQSKRATISLVVSDLFDYFSECATEYEKFFDFVDSDYAVGFLNCDEELISKVDFKDVSVPYEQIRVFEDVLVFFPQYLPVLAEVVSVIQITRTRMRGLARDVVIYNAGYGFNLFNQISILAEAQHKLKLLFAWSRFETDGCDIPPFDGNFTGLYLEDFNRLVLETWWRALDKKS